MTFRAGLSCLSLLAILGTAAPAAASDQGGLKDGPRAATADWSGFSFYVGIGTGSVNHNIKEDHTNYGFKRGYNFGSFDTFDEIAKGIFGTVGVGYDRQVSERFVLGVFTDFDISSMGSKNSFAPEFVTGRGEFVTNGFFPANESTSLEHKYSWNIGGRFGYLIRETSMIYGLVGYTYGKFHQNFGFNGNLVNGLAAVAVTETNSSRDLSFHGITLGAGFEHMLAKNLFVRGEYRYTNFGKESTSDRSDILISGVNAYTMTANGETFDPSMHTGRVSLVVKFNRGEEPVEPYKN